MAQSISAASATVSPQHFAYTQSSSFLRPVSQESIFYRVERVSDGRTFATRLVRAFERAHDGVADNLVYMATISFQSQRPPPEKTLNYSNPLPDLDGAAPDSIPEFSGRLLIENNRSGSLQPFKPEDEPFDWRPATFSVQDAPSDCRTAGFSRSHPLSNSTAAVNLAALAYMSDEILIGVALFANPEAVGPRNRNVAMAATLNHHLWFHDPTAKVDEWMVCERSTSSGADGRVMINQNVWNHQTGRLLLSCTQEALVRLKGSNL